MYLYLEVSESRVQLQPTETEKNDVRRQSEGPKHQRVLKRRCSTWNRCVK